jgi:hypothetical protein
MPLAEAGTAVIECDQKLRLIKHTQAARDFFRSVVVTIFGEPLPTLRQIVDFGNQIPYSQDRGETVLSL